MGMGGGTGIGRNYFRGDSERMTELINVTPLPDGTSLVYQSDTKEYRYASVVRIDNMNGAEWAYADVDLCRFGEKDSDVIRRLNDALMEDYRR